MIEITEQKTAYSGQTFAEEFKKIFLKYFPKSHINSAYKENFQWERIDIGFSLGKDRSEFKGGIPENDPMIGYFRVDLQNKVDIDLNIVSDKLSLEIHRSGGGFLVKPPPEVNLAYSRIKVPYRKTTGSPDKLLQAFEKYVSKLYTTVIEYLDRIEVPFDIYTKFPKVRKPLPQRGRKKL